MPEPYAHYIDGEWVSGAGMETFTSENPATGETIAEFERGIPADVDRAVEAADAAYEEWRERSRIDRAEVLWDVYHELRDRTDELGEVVPSEIAEKDSYMRRKSRGVVGCITPWNFPVAIPYWHMAVALVEGNTVVFKPAEQTPNCARIIAELFDDAGIPDGVFNLVQGFGDAGNALVEHEDVSTILFTGSAEVGHQIQGKLGGVPGKRVACEMGGKNAVVITEHADLDIAVHSAVMSSFKTTGQRCVSAERLVVHTDVYDEFKERFVAIVEDVAVGDPLEEETFMGPLIEADHVEKVTNYNRLAREEGADVLVDRTELADEEIPTRTCGVPTRRCSVRTSGCWSTTVTSSAQSRYRTTPTTGSRGRSFRRTTGR